jgi:hypothetical protein
MNRIKPKVIQEVGFDFSWDEKKVWQIKAPIEQMDIAELVWHLHVPFLWQKPGGYYDLTPHQVLQNPARYADECARVQSADTSYPIDIMKWRGRWVILDGLHRLMKLYESGAKQIEVRKIPISYINDIRK